MLTEPIYDTECIGDSISKINNNFQILDDKIRSVPFLIPGNGTEIAQDSLKGDKYTVKVDVKNSSVFQTSFNGSQGLIADKVNLEDGTSIATYRFPYVDVVGSTKPFGTFNLTSSNDKPARVTLFWTGEGQNDLTVFATNSSTETQTGRTFFNDDVTALYRDGRNLYVGGKFTECGGQTRRKLAVLDLGDQENFPEYNMGLGFESTLLSDPLSSEAGDLGLVGSVNSIAISEQKLQSSDSALADKILFVAGSFNGPYKGRGLCAVILTRVDPERSYYPFYVNGNVHSIKVIGNDLFVGGDFDYVSYGAQEPPIGSERRILANGLVKIKMQLIDSPYCIDEDFARNTRMLFEGPATIFSIDYGTWLEPIFINQIFIGGNFKVSSRGEVLAQNIAAIDSSGTFLNHWNPILDGPVYTLSFSDIRNVSPLRAFLYAGGKFSKYADKTSSQPSVVQRSNAICFIVDYPNESNPYPMEVSELWKPVFNGPVSTIITDGYGDYGYPAASQDYVYCYGHFTAIDEFCLTHIGAITKASHLIFPGVVASQWRPRINSKPELFNNALYRYDNSLIIGGSFDTINYTVRHKLARISKVDEQLTPTTPKEVGWELGVQQIAPGMPLSFDTLSERVSSRTFAEPAGKVTATVFPPIITDSEKNQTGSLYRFYIKRLGNSGYWQDSLKNDSVKVIGWTVDFA